MLPVVVRSLVSVVGGYGVMAGFVALVGLLLSQLGLAASEAVLLAAMLGFPLYLAMLLWGFHARPLRRVVGVIGGGAALAIGLALWLALPPAALGGEALIILPPTTVSSFGQTCRAILDDAGVVPAVTHSADDGQMAAAMAAAGLGIALATRSSVLLHEAVVAVPIESPRARINLMVARRAGPVSAGTSLLWAWLTEARPAAAT